MIISLANSLYYVVKCFIHVTTMIMLIAAFDNNKFLRNVIKSDSYMKDL